MPDSLTVRDGELNTASTVVRGVRQIRTRPGWLSQEIGGTAVFGDATDRWNAITDLGMSGDPRLYETTVNIPSGATQVILTGNTKEIANGFPDTYPLSIYPLAIPQKQTFKVGQDIRIPDGKAANIDLVATITSVVGNVITFTPATTNTNSIDFIQHDDTRKLQEFLDTFLSGYIYFPEGFYPISSHQAYTTGKDYAIQIPATSEALNRQFVFQGLGKYRSGFLHTGNGHAFKLKNTSINNLVFRDLHCSHANRYQLQTLEATTAGCGLLLASQQYTAEGVPQSTATACLIENCIFIGWKYGIFADNLQSSIIQQNSFYYCNNSIHLVATGNVRGIGSQTEPNANQLDKNFIQYSVVLPSNNGRTVTDAVTVAAHDTGGASTGHNASNEVTSASASFVSTDLYRLVKIEGASVNQTTHYAMITSVVSSTKVTLSQPPWIENTGLTMTLLNRSLAHVYLQNASNIGIDGGTWQGNWIGQNAEVHGLFAENLDEITISRLWQEESGGGQGSAQKYVNVRGLTITNSNANANSGTDGYGNCLYLDAVRGCHITSSYFNSSGTATDMEYRNGTRGVFIDHTTFTSPTNIIDGNTGDTSANFYPVQLGAGVRFINSSPAHNNELIQDSFYRNLLTNGNFQEGLTGWTQDKPSALAATNTGTARGLRYITVTPDTGAAQAYVKQMHQTYSVPDSLQQYQLLSLGFDWYIHSRGADAISSAPFYNEMRIKIVWGTGESEQFNINPSSSNGRISAHWNRASLQTRIPSSGAGRTVEVQVECAEGSNAAVFRIANFKLTLSTRATFDDDEVITELQGGNLSAPLRMLDQATPSTPAAGSIKFYSKGEAPTYLNSSGVEYTLATTAGMGITSLNGLTGASQTFVNDTNVTMVSSGTTHTLTWAGTLAAGRLNSSVVQGVTNDTNVTGSIAAQNLTLGWTGTLAAGRLNSNVVQAITNDTNITGSIAAQALTLGWTGTLAAGRLNSNVVQGITNDTNITGSISAQNLTLGFTGTLAAARLNSNVVQSVVNDTNITGSISAQALTLGFTGTLAKARQDAATVYNDQANTWTTGNQQFNDLRVLPTSGASYMRIVATGPYTATRTLTISLSDGSRTLGLAGNVSFSNAMAFAGTTGTITLGSTTNTLSLLTTGNTSVTLPTSGTLLATSGTLTANRLLLGNGTTQVTTDADITYDGTDLDISGGGGLRLGTNNAVTYTGTQLKIGTGFDSLLISTAAQNFEFDANGNAKIGDSALSTSATNGFMYIRSMAGAPSGVPSAFTGLVPMTYDTSNDDLYVYNGGWKKVHLA